MADCYQICNKKYNPLDPKRLFCKKGCDSEDKLDKCKSDKCNKVCIKDELGEGDSKLGSWS